MPNALDTNLAGLASAGRTNIQLRFPPGVTVLTRPIYPLAGWTISGPRSAILRWEPDYDCDPSAFYSCIEMPRFGLGDGITIEGLSLDCNWAAWQTRGARGISGIGGEANNNLSIESVEVFHHGCVQLDLAAAIGGTAIARHVRNVRVNRCVIRDGNEHAHGISFADNRHHTDSASLQIEVTGNDLRGRGFHALGVSQCQRSFIAYNRVEGVKDADGVETGWNSIFFCDVGKVGPGNHYFRNIGSGAHYCCHFDGNDEQGQDEFIVRDTRFENNDFIITPTGEGLFFAGNVRGIRVTGNKIQAAVGIENRRGLWFQDGASGIVTENEVAQGLLIQVP